MALTKQKKNEVVSEVTEALSTAKMTVVASYAGTPVKAMQSLRKKARENNVNVKVIKNRLFLRSMSGVSTLSNIDTSKLSGMLLYAFAPEDEVSAAQVLAEFARQQPSLQFVGAITAEGKFLEADEVKVLAALPNKNTLVSHVVTTLLSPVNDTLNALSGNILGLLDSIESKIS